VAQHDRMSELRDIVKSSSLESFCKMLVDSPEYGSKVSEHEFSALVGDEARKAYPADRADTAFAKYFSENVAIRQAHAVINSHNQQSYLQGSSVEKNSPPATLTPRVSGGADAQDVDNATDAMAKLDGLVAQLRRSHPYLSDAQAFARVYQDPNNHALAEAERRQNRPRAA
jgi:hypothetical protein